MNEVRKNMNSRKLLALIVITGFILIFNVFAARADFWSQIDHSQVDRLHEEIIELAVDSSEALTARGELLAEYREVSVPEDLKSTSLDLDAGLSAGRDEDSGDYYAAPQLGLSMSYPLLAPDSELQNQQARLSFIGTRVDLIQTKEREEKELISGLNDRLDALLALVNEIAGQKRLLSTLQDRQDDLLEMVEAGMVEPDTLWELDERVSDLKIELNNLQTTRLIQLNQLARNYGRENRDQMKDKLTELTGYFEDGDINE